MAQITISYHTLNIYASVLTRMNTPYIGDFFSNNCIWCIDSYSRFVIHLFHKSPRKPIYAENQTMNLSFVHLHYGTREVEVNKESACERGIPEYISDSTSDAELQEKVENAMYHLSGRFQRKGEVRHSPERVVQIDDTVYTFAATTSVVADGWIVCYKEKEDKIERGGGD